MIKLLLLIILTSGVINATPVQDDVSIAAANGIDELLHDREERSSGSTRRPGIPWYLDRIDQRKSQLDGQYNAFSNGTGVDIYMLVDGIDYENEEFGGRAFDGGFMPKKLCTEFGTEFASLAAGIYAGVAKNASIYSINLLTCHLSTTILNVMKAVKHVINVSSLRYKKEGRRSVLAIPIVGAKSYALNAIVEKAILEKIVVVTSAGNSLHDACYFSPGSSPNVINVGAAKMEGGDDKLYQTYFTGINFGKCVSLYAPGQSANHQFRKSTGTVQACGIVAGAAALVLEKFPDYSPAEVKQHLVNEATNDMFKMDELTFIRGDKGANKLLYVGNGDDSIGSDNDTNDHGSSSGYFDIDDTSGDDDNIDPTM